MGKQSLRVWILRKSYSPMHFCSGVLAPVHSLLSAILLSIAAARLGHVSGANGTNDAIGIIVPAVATTAAASGELGPVAGGRLSPNSAFNYTALECNRYDITYSQIESDLDIHRKLGGISQKSTLYAASRLGCVDMRGITVG